MIVPFLFMAGADGPAPHFTLLVAIPRTTMSGGPGGSLS